MHKSEHGRAGCCSTKLLPGFSKNFSNDVLRVNLCTSESFTPIGLIERYTTPYRSADAIRGKSRTTHSPVLPHIDQGVVQHPQRHNNRHVSRSQERDEEGESKPNSSGSL